MKLKKEYILYHPKEGETLAVATGEEAKRFRGLMRANETASLILDCLGEDTTEEAILEKMQQEFRGPEEDMRRDIAAVIGKLRELDALDED